MAAPMLELEGGDTARCVIDIKAFMTEPTDPAPPSHLLAISSARLSFLSAAGHAPT